MEATLTLSTAKIKLDDYEEEIVIRAIRHYRAHLAVELNVLQDELQERCRHTEDDHMNSPELHDAEEWFVRTTDLVNRLKKELGL